MQQEDIFSSVCEVIEESTGQEAASINREHTLFGDLDIDSIDIVDILFELESLYSIELKISDIEKLAMRDLADEPYHTDGVISPEGLDSVRANLPEIDQSKLHDGITIYQLSRLFTVESLCKIVDQKIRARSHES